MSTLIFNTVGRQPRLKWIVAAGSFLVVTTIFFSLLSIIHALPDLTTVPVREKQTAPPENEKRTSVDPPGDATLFAQNQEEPTRLALSPTLAPTAETAERRKFLLQKVQEIGKRRDKLEDGRQHLLHSTATTAKPKDDLREARAPVDIRGQLRAALIQLILLEKTHPDSDPEVHKVRNAITALQSRLVSPKVSPPRQTVKISPPEHTSGNKAELDAINLEIIHCDDEINTYLQQLSRLLDPVSSQDPQPPATSGHAPSLPPKNKLAQRSAEHWPVRLNKAVDILLLSRTVKIVISALFGLLVAVLCVVVIDRRDKTIRDEAGLNLLLPGTVEYIGSIPRMKLS